MLGNDFLILARNQTLNRWENSLVAVVIVGFGGGEMVELLEFPSSSQKVVTVFSFLPS